MDTDEALARVLPQIPHQQRVDDHVLAGLRAAVLEAGHPMWFSDLLDLATEVVGRPAAGYAVLRALHFLCEAREIHLAVRLPAQWRSYRAPGPEALHHVATAWAGLGERPQRGQVCVVLASRSARDRPWMNATTE